MMRSQKDCKSTPNLDLEDAEYSPEYDINLGIVSFAVVTVVFILVSNVLYQNLCIS
jgi:hypothetical protein